MYRYMEVTVVVDAKIQQSCPASGRKLTASFTEMVRSTVPSFPPDKTDRNHVLLVSVLVPPSVYRS
jgi:hypothetical protein